MSKLFEGFLNRNKTSNTSSQATKPRTPESDASKILNLSNYNAWQLISKLRDLNDNYKSKYMEYEAMAEDVIIQSALELYADDATQIDNKSEKIVAIKSKDATLQKDLEVFLESMQVETRIWNWAYDLAKYGDVYLKKHTTDSNDIRFEEVIEPETVMDLFLEGERVAFGEEVYSTSNGGKVIKSLDMHDKDSYVHFMIRRSAKYDTLEIDLTDKIDAKGEPETLKFTVVRGVSMVEGVRSIFRILQLLEDSLLAARIAKAEYIRVYNVEVGEDTPSKTIETVNKVKNLFDAKASFDVSSGKYSANKKYRPIADPVFNPVRNGKGSVTHEDIGGEFEVKNIIDIDYFKNKLFSGLKIPKALLGFEESLPGGLGDNTLMRLDIRYSRGVKRVQVPLINGIKDMCNLWLKLNGREESVNNFTVTLQSPSSSEELARLAELDSRMTTIVNATESMAKMFGKHLNVPKVFKIMFDKYINFPELITELGPEFDSAIKSYEEALSKAKENGDNLELEGEEEYGY